MPDLPDRLRTLVDGAAAPVTLDEVRASTEQPVGEAVTGETGASEPVPLDEIRTSSAASATGSTRRQRLPRGRWLMAAAVVAVVALAGVLFVTLADDNTRVEVGDAPEGADQPLFELLELRPATEPMGTLRAAVTDEELAALWDDVGFDSAAPEVDLGRWVVVSITIPDDACPPVLAGFTRDGDVWTPQFEELDDTCAEPLIPKTYVVAIDRSEVAPAFTLRLPADDTYGFDEQRLEVEVPPGRATANGREADTQTGPAPGATLAVVPLPPRGEARSHLLDGRPVWVVHHDDGSATAVPAVLPPDPAAVPTAEDLDSMFWSIVRWSPQGAFRGPHTWDAWGRALTAGRHADLTDYVAEVDGDRVVVRQWDGERVPGQPVLPSVPVDAGLAPDVVSSPDATGDLPEEVRGLPAGWQMVGVAAVGAEGVLRLCVVTDDSFPPSSCPDDAPVVAGAEVPDGIMSWHFAPLLVRIDDGGQISAVVPLGGHTVSVTP
ncbi:MAG: hypothetical protein JJU45_17455 [Acidimicrobiia bacterium]|nr:hypothetical protein [Acidimicrobiia bacterium]